MTLTFDQQGGYRLKSRCGAELGTAHVSGKDVRFSDARDAGGNYCRDQLYETSVKTLTGDVVWTIQNNELRLTKGATTLVFDA